MTDLDDLNARLRAFGPTSPASPAEVLAACREAAAALEALRDEVARLRAEVEVAQAAWDRDRLVREAAVSEVRKLRAAITDQ